MLNNAVKDSDLWRCSIVLYLSLYLRNIASLSNVQTWIVLVGVLIKKRKK